MYRASYQKRVKGGPAGLSKKKTKNAKFRVSYSRVSLYILHIRYKRHLIYCATKILLLTLLCGVETTTMMMMITDENGSLVLLFRTPPPLLSLPRLPSSSRFFGRRRRLFLQKFPVFLSVRFETTLRRRRRLFGDAKRSSRPGRPRRAPRRAQRKPERDTERCSWRLVWYSRTLKSMVTWYEKRVKAPASQGRCPLAFPL